VNKVSVKMKNDVKDHPAVQFGAWLKAKRRESGVVARVFAGRIDLSPAEYAELESGIVDWLGEKQEATIPLLLNLNDDDQATFNHKLFLARERKGLAFADVYSEDELAPARCSTSGAQQIDEATRQAIIRAVFTPLTRDA
jgi:transcriptional regulator with XRE-family HTH domain